MSTELFLKHTGARHPIICGAMYPCSNPELVAAASKAGGIGIIQPLSLTYVHGHDLRAGIRKIKELAGAPVGFNLLVEKSVKIYQKRMETWLDVALEEGIRFFITALGNPDWVVKKVKSVGGVVYHDVTERKYALKVVDKGVEGLICVNSRAGGHAGGKSEEELATELKDFGLPLVCAGGIGDREGLKRALNLGYSAVQMGTRFIATKECTAHADYKQAIVNATPEQIVLTNKVTGVPLAVIETPHVKKVGTQASGLAKWLLKGRRSKHLMRLLYQLSSVMRLKRSNFKPLSTKDFWQAGKSVGAVQSVKSVAEIIQEMTTP